MLPPIPPIRYTPRAYRVMPEPLRVTWEYRADYDSARAFSERYEARVALEARYEAFRRLTTQRARLALLAQSNEIKRRIEAVDKQLEELGEVEDLSDGDKELEYLAGELGDVVTGVIVRKVSLHWPSDTEGRIAILRQMPPPTIAELRQAINFGLFDVEEVGKS